MDKRPELGDIKVGDPVIITSRGYRQETVEAHVFKAARVWITLQESNQPESRTRMWRMRRDTQDENTGYGCAPSFATLEQHAWDQRAEVARQFLREQGISIDFTSQWYKPERRIQLADIIRAGIGSPVSTSQEG